MKLTKEKGNVTNEKVEIRDDQKCWTIADSSWWCPGTFGREAALDRGVRTTVRTAGSPRGLLCFNFSARAGSL